MDSCSWLYSPPLYQLSYRRGIGVCLKWSVLSSVTEGHRSSRTNCSCLRRGGGGEWVWVWAVHARRRNSNVSRTRHRLLVWGLFWQRKQSWFGYLCFAFLLFVWNYINFVLESKLWRSQKDIRWHCWGARAQWGESRTRGFRGALIGPKTRSLHIKISDPFYHIRCMLKLLMVDIYPLNYFV
jgi:hypothetical protein